MGEYLKKACMGITRVYPDIAIKEANCDEDHIHLLMSIPLKRAVSWVVNVLKANTARLFRQKYLFLKKLYPKKAGMRSVGYFVSTVGVNEQVIAAYIRHQGDEDRGQAKLDF
ncbi:MAG: IS200/IS605 family transposase [Candidatus Omnitrophota bacterium]